MANLNLSQFTEKTFVADADWTFVWDAAGSISKKVSRNNWLNSGTLATSAPVTISQTWNASTNVMTALKVVATDTASGTASNLLELWSGSTPALKSYVTKSGSFVGGVVGAANPAALAFPVSGSYSVGVYSPASYKIQFAMTSGVVGGSVASAYTGMQYEMSGGVLSWGLLNQDIVLARDSQDTLALRNGAAAQTFNIYNTYQNAGVDYERIAFKWSANLFTIGREFGGTGGARNINIIGGGSVLGIGSAATAAVSWTFSSNNLLAGSDNLYDIGASGANRPRNVYVAGFVRVDNQLIIGSGSSLLFSSYGAIKPNGDSIWSISNSAGTDFIRLQLGGTTDSFPAIARDGAGIKFTGAATGSTSHIKVPAVAVLSLPAAATAGVGARAFVNDALAPVFGNTVATGGAVAVPVYSDGSAWKVG